MRRRTFGRCVGVLAAIMVFSLFSPVAFADQLSFLPANTFSGTAPAGTLTIDFEQVAANQVSLTIGFPTGSGSNLASGENLDPGKALYLNINPAKSSSLANLTFTLQSNVGFSQAANVQKGEDGFKADGDGYYDMLVTYSGGTKAFTAGESQTYLITETAGNAISPFDFSSFQSSPGGGNGTWYAAIHVQNTPNGGNGSAWVGSLAPTPEPASFTLWGLTLLGVIGGWGFKRLRGSQSHVSAN